MEYRFADIENEIKQFWEKQQVYKVEINHSKPKYYVLDMFPYPSGAGLHVGHPLGYIASDIFARYKRMKGFNVLHPMGYDSFGLPAEQYAIQTGQHPAITTEQNLKRYREQLDKIGFSFDWSRQVKTSDPEYYKWTQWIFIQLFKSWYNKKTDKAEHIDTLIAEFEKNGNTNVEAVCSDFVHSKVEGKVLPHGEDLGGAFTASDWKSWSEKQQQQMLLNYRLAYLADSWVNWCPALGTVLANDEVKDGVSERGGYPVEQRLMKQWSLRITAYSERLLQGLNEVEWSESIKEAQRNWIGRSEGARVKFRVSPTKPPRGGGLQPSSEDDTYPQYKTANPVHYDFLKEKSREMRNNQTEAEQIVWGSIKDEQLGTKFRRQHIVGDFIADFISLELKLVIEIDGGIHHKKTEEDKARDNWFEDRGFRTLRFTNEQVIVDINTIIAEIKREVEIRNAAKVLPHGEDLGGAHFIEVFTTRPDTIFGVTFMVLAPEHELVKEITTPEQKEKVEAYIKKASSKSERERNADVKNVSGEFTGAYVIHPFTGKDIPVYIADYVLATYGTGAVMAVPSGDSRDFRFAKHFNLPIPNVFEGVDVSEQAYEEKTGRITNSDFLNGLEVPAAMKKAIEEIEKKGIGEGKVNYRQRDAIFGRQRYWGEPIPIYYKEGIPYPVEEKDLPVVLPEIDKYLPTETGEPPLARAKNWTYTPSPALPPGGREQETSSSKGREDASPLFFTANSSGWKYLSEFAKQHRDNPTPAEKIIWEKVRNHQLGEHIRQQHIIGNFIVDFVCLNKGLVIEIDGDIHDLKKEEDAARENYLKELGYTVIRFTNEEVINDTINVLNRIKQTLSSLPDNFFTVQEQKKAEGSLGQGIRTQTLPQGEGLKVSPLGGDLEGVNAEAYPLELTTMPGWAGSSWYYLRYMDPHNPNAFAGKEALDYWKNIDFYIGGSEHATGHLLYFRFWTKFLNDLGYISIDEPAKKMVNQGMIQGVSQYIKYRGYQNKNNIMEHHLYTNVDSFQIYGENYTLNEIAPYVFTSNVEENIGFHSESVFESQGYVNINCVKDGVLDFETFERMYPHFKNSIYLTPLGYYQKNVFYPYRKTDPYIVPTDSNYEYFKKFRTRSAVEKMSKSKLNVVTPDNLYDDNDRLIQKGIIDDYGADCFRMYEMFLGPIELSKPWDTQGIDGTSRFLRKLWRLFYNEETGKFLVTDDVATTEELKTLHKTIKKVNEDIERLAFNTSVSAFMVCVNELSTLKCSKRSVLEPLISILHPFAPFITEYLWKQLGHEDSVLNAPFPIADESLLVENSYEYPVSVNGKVRAKLNLPLELQQADVEKEVLALDIVQKWLEGKAPKKVIYVKGRMINVVV